MRTNRNQYASANTMPAIHIIGTEQHYRESVSVVGKADLTTMEYIEYFRKAGHSTPTAIGKAAVVHAMQFDNFGVYSGKSVSSIHKAESKGELPSSLVYPAKWIWKIETRARQLFDKDGNVKGVSAKSPVVGLNPQQAQQTTSPEQTATSGQAASGQSTGKGGKLKNVNTLPVERVAIQMLVDLLDKGIANESWQEIADCRKMLSGFLA